MDDRVVTGDPHSGDGLIDLGSVSGSGRESFVSVRRRPIAWSLAVAALVTVAAVGHQVLSYQDSPRQAVDRYIGAARSDDILGVWGLTCGLAFRHLRMPAREEFPATFGSVYWAGVDYWLSDERMIPGQPGAATVDIRVSGVVDGRAVDRVARVVVLREADRWKVCNFNTLRDFGD